MKNIFYMLLLVIASLTTIQAQDGLIGAIRFTASIGNFTPHGTYDYVGTVGNIGSTGFTVNNITVGAYLLDDNSLYYIDSVDIVVANNVATIWITDLNGVGTPVSGRGQITQGGSNFDLLPVTQHGSNFITAEQTAKLLTHNFMVIDSLMGEFGVNLGDGNQLLISNRTLDFDDKTYTWDLRDTNLDEDTWTVLTRDGQSYGFFTGDGAGDVSLKFDALISGDYRNLIRSDRFLDIFVGNSTDTVNIVGKTLKLDLSGLLTDDNNTANVLSYDPISKQIKLTDISNVGINPTDTIFYTKIDNITTPINVKDTLVFDFDNTISETDTLFYVESNNTVTATMKGDTLFFGLGELNEFPEIVITNDSQARLRLIDSQADTDSMALAFIEFMRGANSLGVLGYPFNTTNALHIFNKSNQGSILFGTDNIAKSELYGSGRWRWHDYGGGFFDTTLERLLGTIDADGNIGTVTVADFSANVLLAANTGNVAYLLESGGSGIIGNPFDSYGDLDEAFTELSGTGVVSAKQGLFNYSTTSTASNLLIDATSQVTFKNTLATTESFWYPSNGGSLIIAGKPDFLLDTTDFNNAIIGRNTGVTNFSLDLDLGNVYAYRPSITTFNRAVINRPVDSGKFIKVKADLIRKSGHLAIFGDNAEIFDIRVIEYQGLDDAVTNNVANEGFTRFGPRGDFTQTVENSFFNIEIEKFSYLGTARLAGIVAAIADTGKEIYRSKININIGEEKIPNIDVGLNSITGVSPSINGMTSTVVACPLRESDFVYKNGYGVGGASLGFTGSTDSIVKSLIRVDMGLMNTTRRVLQMSRPIRDSKLFINCRECVVSNDVVLKFKNVIDTLTEIVVTGNYTATSPTYAVVYSDQNLTVENAVFTGSGLYIDSTLPITVNACNTNLTRSKVGANVTLIYCPDQGEHQKELFTATAAQTTQTTSTGQLPQDAEIFVDGVLLTITEEYTINSATGTVTFITPLTLDQKITIKWFN